MRGCGMAYIDGSLRSYLEDLAAKKPAPGGGSAAALAASIGAGLMSMVANYTVGNPKYAASQAAAADIMVKVQRFNAQLHDLIDEDVAAYEKLSRHMKELKSDPARLEQAMRDAALPPLKVCKISAECLRLCKDLVSCGNRTLVTDTAIAAVMLEGAFFSAKYNVYANLKSIKDIGFVEETHAVIAPLDDEMPKLKEEILELCEGIISS